MSRINTNISALQAIHRGQRNHAELSLRLERLSSGLRINRGRDDPAGLIISERLRTEQRTLEQAIQNSIRADNVIRTAEGALNEVSALLIELQGLLVATSNDGGLVDEEIAANQLAVDSILASIDRIGNTTTFGGRKLLDGSLAYVVSSVDPTAIASVALFGVHIPSTGTRDVSIRVTQSAQTAGVSFIGTTAGGISTTSATSVEIRGTLGATLLSFATGTTLAQVRTAINASTGLTGVSAVVSTPSVAGVASSMLLNSTTFGSDAFVSIEPINGNFIEASNNNTEVRDVGVDVGTIINGRRAAGKGLRTEVRTPGLDTRIFLTQAFAQTLSTASFSVTGGGALFQLAPEIVPQGQIFVGIDPIRAAQLGNSVVGLLHSLHSGGSNDLRSKNFLSAQRITSEAIEQIATSRGRLGTIQKNHIDSNLATQRIALENITAAESIIRDADMAVEVSALTRAQILVQSTQSTLQIANTIPGLVLSLLG